MRRWAYRGGLAAESGALDALDILGVRFLLLGLGSELYPIDAGVAAPGAPGHYRPLAASGTLHLFENPSPWPRAFLVAARELPTVHALREAFEEGHVPAGLISFRPGEAVFEVPAGASGLFVFTDQYYPGWTAHADGHAAEIVSVAGVFRGVEIPPQTSEVVFRYEPASIRWGFAISACTLVGLILLAVVLKAAGRTGP